MRARVPARAFRHQTTCLGYDGRLQSPSGGAGYPANSVTDSLPICVTPASVNMNKSFVLTEPTLKLEFVNPVVFTNVQGIVWRITCRHVHRRGVDLHWCLKPLVSPHIQYFMDRLGRYRCLGCPYPDIGGRKRLMQTKRAPPDILSRVVIGRAVHRY